MATPKDITLRAFSIQASIITQSTSYLKELLLQRLENSVSGDRKMRLNQAGDAEVYSRIDTSMNIQALIRLLGCIVFGTIVSSLWHCTVGEASSRELPSTLFGVYGILFPVALAIVTSIDLMRVKNRKYRLAFRKSISRVRTSLIVQFILSLFAISVVLLCRETKVFLLSNRIYIDSSLIASVVIVYALAHSIYNYILLQRFKEELEDKLEEEGQ